MKLSERDITVLSELAREAAHKAAKIIESKRHDNWEIEHKSDMLNLASQVVTEVDQASQEAILMHLGPSIEQFDLGLLTEESVDDESRFKKDYFWCIDPLDGTLPYTEGKAGYAVSIALIRADGTPMIGVVVNPHQMDEWLAVKNRGVLKNRKEFTFQTKSKEQTLVCHFDRSFLKLPYYDHVLKELEQIRESVDLQGLEIHTGPGAVMNAIGLLDVNTGCYFKFPKKENGGGCIWDYAATNLIFNELGLSSTTISGFSIPLNQMGGSFMNEQGIVYSTDSELTMRIIELWAELNKQAREGI